MRGNRVGRVVVTVCGLCLLLALVGAAAPGDGSHKLGPVLRMLTVRNEQALATTGLPLDLSPYAYVTEVFADDAPVLPEPQGLSPQETGGKVANRIGILIRTDGSVDAVRAIKAIGARVDTVCGEIVTAIVTLDQVARITVLPQVVYVEAARRVEPTVERPTPTRMDRTLAPTLDVSVPETGVSSLWDQGYYGEGVMIGDVDTGIDYDHMDFRSGETGEPNSRIARIWKQWGFTQRSAPVEYGFTYGTEYWRSDIESDIANGYIPYQGVVWQSDDEGHGTHVMGIAAGDGSSSTAGYVGMAPQADMAMVNTTWYDREIVDGVSYIFQVADDEGKPTVVNLSLGGHFGPHDGTSNFELALSYLGDGPGRAIVVSAGNEGDSIIHDGFDLPPGGSWAHTYFNVPSGPDYAEFRRFGPVLDFWYQGDARFYVEVWDPSGTWYVGAAWGQWAEANTPCGYIYIDNASGYSPNEDNELVIWIMGSGVDPSYSDVCPGDWLIEITDQGTVGGRIDGWSIYEEAQFIAPSQPFQTVINGVGQTCGDTRMTVAMPGTAFNVITVGAYVTKRDWTDIDGNSWWYPTFTVDDIAYFSSLGPTRPTNGDWAYSRLKPDIAAPGAVISSALSDDFNCAGDPSCRMWMTDNFHWIMMGTSMSAPHVAGAAALLLQQDPTRWAGDIQDILTSQAKSDSYTGSTPNNTWGYGKLDLLGMAAPDTIGVFRGTPWYLDSNGDVAWNGAIDITYDAFGIGEDRPIAGDWDGNGYDEIGVYRPSTGMWYLDYNGNGAWDPGIDGALGPFGISEDRPIAGDWDGNGYDEIGVYRPSTRMWYLDYNGNGAWDPGVDGALGPFGISEDLPIAGDWAGNGSDEFGVFRPSAGFFYLDYDGDGGWNGAVDKSYNFGVSGDLPVAGDWNCDGHDKIGIYRPSTRMWYLDYNGNGALDAGETFGPFGVSYDRPIAGRWQNGVGVGPSSVPMSMVSSPVVLVMPNPVTVGGEVTFQVMGAGIDAIQVSIYDLGGGLVYQSELVSGQSVTWDLRFEEGTPVANGVYLYAVTAKAYGELIPTKVGKLLILR